MIREAITFAEKAHAGAVRKGTKIPYIVHPLETAVIVALMTGDEEVIAAAVPHDVVEDTPVTGEEIAQLFGRRVASLVLEETDDKSQCWKVRKARKLEMIRHASLAAKMITLGDKLSNMRSTAQDYLTLGDKLWERFNEKNKSSHGWYYWGMAEGLKELEHYPAYQEYVELCRLVFGDRPF